MLREYESLMYFGCQSQQLSLCFTECHLYDQQRGVLRQVVAPTNILLFTLGAMAHLFVGTHILRHPWVTVRVAKTS